MIRYKSVAKKILVNTPFFIPAILKCTRDINPRVLVYHRFCNFNDFDEHKIDNESFEWQLNIISRYFEVLSLGEIFELKQSGKKIPNRTVVLTIDDGYKDFYLYGFPILKKMGMKATFFVTVNFINQKSWLWPDRIKYALYNTNVQKVNFHFNNQLFHLDLCGNRSKFNSWNQLSNYCITIKNDEKWKLINSLDQELGVNIPKDIPEEYLPVTWQELKLMNENGIEIGSHTMNHPILSKINHDELYNEIYNSKIEIESNLNSRVFSFCYPNSAPGDINDTVIKYVKSAGYRGAVFGGLPGSHDIFQIPRIGINRIKTEFLLKLSGMDYLINQRKTPQIF